MVKLGVKSKLAAIVATTFIVEETIRNDWINAIADPSTYSLLTSNLSNTYKAFTGMNASAATGENTVSTEPEHTIGETCGFSAAIFAAITWLMKGKGHWTQGSAFGSEYNRKFGI